MRTFILLVLMAALQIPVNAQNTGKKTETVVIHTSAVCEMCKHTIETALYKVKGVISANLDLATKDVTVTYKTALTGKDAIKKAIAAAGYDADDVKADAKAYDGLHTCCKKQD